MYVFPMNDHGKGNVPPPSEGYEHATPVGYTA